MTCFSVGYIISLDVMVKIQEKKLPLYLVHSEFKRPLKATKYTKTTLKKVGIKKCGMRSYGAAWPVLPYLQER